jgi:hypothetical protein
MVLERSIKDSTFDEAGTVTAKHICRENTSPGIQFFSEFVAEKILELIIKTLF